MKRQKQQPQPPSKEETADELEVRSLMSRPESRAYVAKLLDWCGVFTSSYVDGVTERTIFLEGQRNVGLRLYHDLQTWCPELYGVMMKEKEENAD